MKGLLYSCENNDLSVISIDNEKTLENLYDVIGCNLVQTVSIEVCGEIFDIIFDKEYRLTHDELECSILLGELCHDCFFIIYGNFVVLKVNSDGDWESISCDETIAVLRYLKKRHLRLLKAVAMGLIKARIVKNPHFYKK